MFRNRTMMWLARSSPLEGRRSVSLTTCRPYGERMIETCPVFMAKTESSNWDTIVPATK